MSEEFPKIPDSVPEWVVSEDEDRKATSGKGAPADPDFDALYTEAREELFAWIDTVAAAESAQGSPECVFEERFFVYVSQLQDLDPSDEDYNGKVGSMAATMAAMVDQLVRVYARGAW